MPWPQTKLLSIAINIKSYEQKPSISSSMQNLVLIWLYYIPLVLTSSELLSSFLHKPMPKPIKKEKVKIEKKIKEEKNIKLESTKGQKWLHAHLIELLLVIYTNTIINR